MNPIGLKGLEKKMNSLEDKMNSKNISSDEEEFIKNISLRNKQHRKDKIKSIKQHYFNGIKLNDIEEDSIFKLLKYSISWVESNINKFLEINIDIQVNSNVKLDICIGLIQGFTVKYTHDFLEKNINTLVEMMYNEKKVKINPVVDYVLTDIKPIPLPNEKKRSLFRNKSKNKNKNKK